MAEEPDPFDLAYSMLQDRDREIRELQAENDQLKNVIRGALRIESLWLPAVVSKEHEHEASALHLMRDSFLAATTSQTGEQL